MKKYFVLFPLFLALGCTPTRTLTYWDLPTTYQMPQTEQELDAECLRIRQEIVTQRTIANMAVPNAPFYLQIQYKSQQNIAWLKHRAAKIGCPPDPF